MNVILNLLGDLLGSDIMEILNRKARFDYFIEDEIEAGIVLTGTEIKAIRGGNCNLKDCYAIVKNGELSDICEYIKGPDFPTGGIIMGRSGIRAAYATGRGKIILRGKAEIEEVKNGKYRIVITFVLLHN